MRYKQEVQEFLLDALQICKFIEDGLITHSMTAKEVYDRIIQLKDKLERAENLVEKEEFIIPYHR